MSGLSKQDMRQLTDGTRILVTWSGGNGPHEYVLRFDAWGTPYAETDFAHGGNVRHRLDDASTVRVASDEDAETRFARDHYTTPGEPFPGARSLEAWKLVDLWVMPSTCRTVRDAMKIVGAA